MTRKTRSGRFVGFLPTYFKPTGMQLNKIINMKTFKDLLKELDACSPAIQWAADKTWQEVYDTCHRGEWLLWLFKRTNGNKRMLALAKGHCANTVRHLMKDKRSIKAVEAAIAYGEGKISDEELAYAAPYAAYADAYVAAAAADDAANRKLTANICRKYLPIESFNISTP